MRPLAGVGDVASGLADLAGVGAVPAPHGGAAGGGRHREGAA
jgi:hypothetical protein